MKIIEPYFTIESEINSDSILKAIELAGRTSYKSEDRITPESAESFVQMIMKNNHLAVIEHQSVTVRIICDRGVSHEIVRHRIASYVQESSRFCNYSKGKFGSEITVIKPCFYKEDTPLYNIWKYACELAEQQYMLMIDSGATAQEARSVLPNSLKTEIVVTMNLREWRHFFTLRTAKAAHPQMREIAIPLLNEFKSKIPIIFDDILS
jgi:thymidylate synthase (FAD)